MMVAIRFQADKAMPAALVRKLIKARIAENVGRSNKVRQRRLVGAQFPLEINVQAMTQTSDCYYLH